MSKKDTKKASKTVMAAEFLFSNELSFHEAFPEIEDLCITVTETQGKVVFDGTKLSPHSTRIYGTNVGECIDCHSPFCVNGGLSIREILRAMVRTHEHSSQGTRLCEGSEGELKESRASLLCNHCFQFKIEVQYRDEAALGLEDEAYHTRHKNYEDKSLENSWSKNLPARSQHLQRDLKNPPAETE